MPSMPQELKRYSLDCSLPFGVARTMCCRQCQRNNSRSSEGTHAFLDQEEVYELKDRVNMQTHSRSQREPLGWLTICNKILS